MKRFINFYNKLANKISGISDKNCNIVIPVCIPVTNMEWEEVYYTIQSLVDTVSSSKLEIRVITRDRCSFEEKNLLFLNSEDIRISIVQADDWVEQMSDYEKWIYLSPGCIVCRSLMELYETDFTNQAFAAALFLKNQIHYRYIRKRVNVEPDIYVDTSVMLVNEPVLKRYYTDIRSEFIRRREAPNALQDAMNWICSGHIHILEQEWNCSWQTAFADSRNEFLLYEDSLRYQKGMSYPGIMNYTGIYKPWSYPIRKESGYYWRTARNTPFFEKRVDNLSQMTGIKAERIRNEIEAVIMECG